MTIFLDGPAKGQTLMLSRTPWLLRVTQETLPESGKLRFDALNELGDSPTPAEKLHAYVLVEYRGHAFVDGAKVRGRFAMASYKLVATGQPTDAQMRDEGQWLKISGLTDASLDASPHPSNPK